MTQILSEEEASRKTRIIDALVTGVVEVVFTKVEGGDRTMLCTLKPEFLPKREEVVGEEKKPKRSRPPSIVVVWDMDQDAWRSFNISSVISWRKA